MKEKHDILPKDFLIYNFWNLSEDEKVLFQKQWTLINQYNQKGIHNSDITIDTTGKIVLTEGTLIHGTKYNIKTVENIAKTGILAGEFFGVPEDGETYYCADFHKIIADIKIEDSKLFNESSSRC